jgi:hypothetical protein
VHPALFAAWQREQPRRDDQHDQRDHHHHKPPRERNAKDKIHEYCSKNIKDRWIRPANPLACASILSYRSLRRKIKFEDLSYVNT